MRSVLKNRRRFLKAAVAAGVAGLSGKVGAKGNIPAILLLLDEPRYYTGTIDLPPDSPFFPITNLPLCIKETDNQIELRFLTGYIVRSATSPRKFPFSISLEFFDFYRLIFTANLTPSGQIAGSVVLETFTGSTILSTSPPENFTANYSPIPCNLESTKLIFSNCVVTRAEELSAQTSVDFSFVIQTDPPIDYTTLTTLDFDLTFQPSNTVINAGGVAVPNAQGAAQRITDSLFNTPINISGQTSVEVKIRSYDDLDESVATPCIASSPITNQDLF